MQSSISQNFRLFSAILAKVTCPSNATRAHLHKCGRGFPHFSAFHLLYVQKTNITQCTCTWPYLQIWCRHSLSTTPSPGSMSIKHTGQLNSSVGATTSASSTWMRFWYLCLANSRSFCSNYITRQQNYDTHTHIHNICTLNLVTTLSQGCNNPEFVATMLSL